MSRFFVHLAYRGSKYRGWQWQPNVQSTVQGFLEDTFEIIFKEKGVVYYYDVDANDENFKLIKKKAILQK